LFAEEFKVESTLTLLDVLLLALIQGVAEWLPISSSGHLAIAQRQLGLKVPVLFDVMLHVGTLGVVLIAFRKDIVKILRAIVRLDTSSNEGKLALFIIVGNVPTAVVGLIFRETFKSFFSNLTVVGAALICTGVLLLASRLKREEKKLGYVDSLLIGTAQGLALIPGISRSGATIAVGLLLGVERETAFKYSFLLSVPAIVGATVEESTVVGGFGVDVFTMLLGVFFAMLVGYASLKAFSRVVKGGKLHLFAPYCLILGLTVLLASLR